MIKKFISLFKKSGISQNELSRRTGITPANISRYINMITEPSPTTFERMCEAIGVKIVLKKK